MRAAAIASRTPPGPGVDAWRGRGRLEAAVTDRRGHLLVRIAERHPALDERLGGVGRQEQRVVRRCREPLAVELEAPNERRQGLQRAGQVGSCSEDRCLVLLQVAVVGERQALHGREQPGQPADRRAGLAAHELGHIRVQLLGHHRRPRRDVLPERGEAELARRPEDDLLAEPREVNEAERHGVEVVEREVPVRDRVERVPHLAGRRRERQGRPGEGACSERALTRGGRGRAEPAEVALQHLDPREQMVADGHGLGALEMRVAGHRRLRVGLGAVQQDSCERRDCRARLGTGVGDVEPERRGDLVVAGAAGVDLPADIAEQALDRRVHVFVAGLDPAAGGDLGEPAHRLLELTVVEQAGGVQPAGVDRRRLAVVREQLRVVGPQKRRHGGIELAPDPPGPEGHASVFARLRAAASSISKEEILMNPSAAAWGNVSPVPYEASCSA